ASGKGASTTGAPAETPARRKADWRGPGSTVAASAAGSDSSRLGVVIAPPQGMARAHSRPTGPAAAPPNSPPAAPPRRPTRRAGAEARLPDHPSPQIAAAAHNSASANRRGLAIARLPPFGYRKARRTAGTR